MDEYDQSVDPHFRESRRHEPASDTGTGRRQTVLHAVRADTQKTSESEGRDDAAVGSGPGSAASFGLRNVS